MIFKVIEKKRIFIDSNRSKVKKLGIFDVIDYFDRGDLDVDEVIYFSS